MDLELSGFTYSVQNEVAGDGHEPMMMSVFDWGNVAMYGIVVILYTESVVVTVCTKHCVLAIR